MSFRSIIWKERICQWKLASQNHSYRTESEEEIPDATECSFPEEREHHQSEMDNDLRQLLSRKVPIPRSMINPYRVVIVFRLVILAFFLWYRLINPVSNAHGLWLVSVFCEIWFSVSWILDQLPKWQPVTMKTYPEHLCLRALKLKWAQDYPCFRYNQAGKPSELSAIDVFVVTVDPLKELPLNTANTILSILSVEFPAEKVSCYVSDDEASLLTLETLSETCEFARKWVPFCKKFNIEPWSPECYFSQKVDFLKYNIFPTFPRDRRLLKRQYEDFTVRINNLVAKFENVPSDGWTMKDGSPWPGINFENHPGMIKILIDHGWPHGNYDKELPQLVYISRERLPGFQHNSKAGAMNALIRVSALLTNGPYILNLDCNHYINNSKALLEAMCFMMDPSIVKKACYVQFRLRFDSIDVNDQNANNTILYDISLKGLDGIQGPISVGTGCLFNRKALYGYDPPLEPKLPKMNCWKSSKKDFMMTSVVLQLIFLMKAEQVYF